MLLTKSIAYIDPEDRVVEGLRIPANLNTVNSVSFVLTQEPGKLKPKDLKMAIERNRAEREHRAEEQRKLREEGGGAGMLDLRGILAEEKLNAKEGDAFQRQLREMAFLADVEEVEKLETEKTFRVSEDYLGSHLMNAEDIDFVYRQREMTRVLQMKGRWRHRQARQSNARIASNHPSIKAGVLKNTAQELMTSLFPQYDPNKNDIWQKRLNTLRRFVYLVSTWLVRERLTRRMRKVVQYFHDHGAYTRAEVRAFIERENQDKSSSLSTTTTSSAEKEEKERKAAELAALNKAAAAAMGLAAGATTSASSSKAAALSAAEVIFSKPNTNLLKILRHHQLIQEEAIRVKEGRAEITTTMASRLMYPTFDRNILTDDRSPNQRGLLSFSECLGRTLTFDDRSFFHQKIQPDYQYRQYTEHAVASLVPLHFPAEKDKPLRSGAPEEYNLRVPGDGQITTVEHRHGFYVKHEKEPVEVVDKMLVEVHGLTTITTTSVSIHAHHTSSHTKTHTPESPNEHRVHDHQLLPAWIQSSGTSSSSSSSGRRSLSTSHVAWKAPDLDLLTPRPEFRAYLPPLLRTELDVDAVFHYPPRPPHRAADGGTETVDALIRHRMQRDASLRNQWQDAGAGYLCAHYYLLGGAESRWRPAPSIPYSSSSHQGGGVSTAAADEDPDDRLSFPPMGPLLSDYYQPDHDRHVSGLNCFARDHTRDVTEWDADVARLQHTQDASDKLTDSESDHDDDFYYEALKPSVRKVRDLLHPPKPVVADVAPAKGDKNAKGGKAPAPAAAAPTTKDDNDGAHEDSFLMDGEIDASGHQKNEAQVELLRDRKTLDLESTVWRSRKDVLDGIYRRQVQVANASISVLQATRVQLPFHVFEDVVYKDLSSANTGSRFYVPTPSNVFVEADPTKTHNHGSLSVTSLPSAAGAGLTSMASPSK